MTVHPEVAAWPLLCSQLLAQMLEASCIVDGTSQHIVAANPAACTLLGLPVGELIGSQVTTLCPTPEDLCFWSDATLSGPGGAGLHSDSLLGVRPPVPGLTARDADCAAQPLHWIDVERRLAPLVLPDGRHAWLLTWRDLSASRGVERELDRLAAALHDSLDSHLDAVLVTDLHGAMRGCNQAFARLWSLPHEVLQTRDDAHIQAALRASVADAAGYDNRLAELATDASLTATDRITLSDGRVLERRVLPQFGRGAPVGRLWAWRDISQRLADEARLRLAGQVFDASLDAILVTDHLHRVVAANPAAALLLQRPGQALQGQALTRLIHDPDRAVTLAQVFATVEREGHWQGDLSTCALTPAEGEGTPVQVSIQWRRSADASLGDDGCIVILRDQSERRAQQDALRELLRLDLLTGLPNRHRLEARLAQRHEDNAGAAGHPGYALLLVGLDRFGPLNDALGHGGGDRTLIEVGMRLTSVTRPDDMVARLGGDTFAVLLAQADTAQAQACARRLLDALAADLCVDGLRFSLSASIGIVCGPHDGADLDTLLRHADSAMQRVKQRSGGGTCCYEPRMSSDLLPRIQLDHAMRQALRAGQFHLHYQPQVEIGGQAIVGAEALLRWRDPELGDIPPGRFIPVAEETGFIAELGLWVLGQAIAQASAWRQRGLHIPVAVNVSVLQFQQAGLVDQVAALLQAHALPPAMLELELTESVLLGDIAEIIDQLERLAALGVRLAIDDFGTGYSGLAYLKRLPIHRLKIDRCFIRDLPGDTSDAAITRSVIELARALNLQVTAEGVETEAQRAFLAELGCKEFQGWLFAPALAPEQFAQRALRAASLVAEPTASAPAANLAPVGPVAANQPPTKLEVTTLAA